MTRLSLNAGVLLVFTAISGAVFVYAPVVRFSEQWPLYEALRTTAAIIFAVVGAWIAIAFPERLRLLTGSKRGSQSSANARMLDLFAPVVNSTITLCAILLIGIAAPILKGMVTEESRVTALRSLSFSLLVFLTLWQVWTVVLTLVPADLLKTAMDSDLSEKRARDALRGNAALVAPPKDELDR